MPARLTRVLLPAGAFLVALVGACTRSTLMLAPPSTSVPFTRTTGNGRRRRKGAEGVGAAGGAPSTGEGPPDWENVGPSPSGCGPGSSRGVGVGDGDGCGAGFGGAGGGGGSGGGSATTPVRFDHRDSASDSLLASTRTAMREPRSAANTVYVGASGADLIRSQLPR